MRGRGCRGNVSTAVRHRSAGVGLCVSLPLHLARLSKLWLGQLGYPVRLSEVDAVQCRVPGTWPIQIERSQAETRHVLQPWLGSGRLRVGADMDQARSCACTRRYAGKSEAARMDSPLGSATACCSTYFEAVPFPSPPVCFRQN